MKPIQLASLIALAALMCGIVAGCGGAVRCDAPADKTLPLMLTPDAVLVGQQTTVVATFDESVFVNGDFPVADTDVVIYDPADKQFIGQFSDSTFRMGQGDPPFVSGVILSGEVIDDRSIELIIEFPADATVGSLRVEARASNGGVECHVQVLGEASLEVASGT